MLNFVPTGNFSLLTSPPIVAHRELVDVHVALKRMTDVRCQMTDVNIAGTKRTLMTDEEDDRDKRAPP